MAQQKFLFIYRTPPGTARQTPPSPQEMQELMARWQGWKAKFASNVVDLGDALKPGGRQLASGVVTDGAFIESKEVVGGYSIIAANGYDEAIAVARECPITQLTGHVVEIRELAGY